MNFSLTFAVSSILSQTIGQKCPFRVHSCFSSLLLEPEINGPSGPVRTKKDFSHWTKLSADQAVRRSLDKTCFAGEAEWLCYFRQCILAPFLDSILHFLIKFGSYIFQAFFHYWYNQVFDKIQWQPYYRQVR